MRRNMEINLEIKDNYLIIYLPKELDHHTARDIREEADKILNEEVLEGVIFDFNNTAFMDSSGIGMIMGRYKMISQKGGIVGVTGINAAIHRILELSGLYKIVEVY